MKNDSGELNPAKWWLCENDYCKNILVEKDRLQELVNDTDRNITTWVDEAEKKLIFAETARQSFMERFPEKQRNILEALGANFVLKDRIFSFDLENIFESVRTASETVKKLHNRLEPVEKGYTKTQYAEMYQTDPQLGAYRELNPD